MTDGKLYLLAEISPLPQYVAEVKAIFSRLLPIVLREEGCEAMYTTSTEADPDKLIFFEIFTSEAAHRFHLEQEYTHQMAADLEGKLAGPMVMTRLHGF